jgi:hypothetical protein
MMFYRDKRRFLSTWLSADSSKLRTSRSAELDVEKRLKTLLDALSREDPVVKNGKVLRLKPRSG